MRRGGVPVGQCDLDAHLAILSRKTAHHDGNKWRVPRRNTCEITLTSTITCTYMFAWMYKHLNECLLLTLTIVQSWTSSRAPQTSVGSEHEQTKPWSDLYFLRLYFLRLWLLCMLLSLCIYAQCGNHRHLPPPPPPSCFNNLISIRSVACHLLTERFYWQSGSADDHLKKTGQGWAGGENMHSGDEGGPLRAELGKQDALNCASVFRPAHRTTQQKTVWFG